MVLSGASRRAKASAVARSHWSIEGLDRLLAHAHREDGHLVELGSAVGELQPQPRRVLELVPARGHVEQGDAVQAVGRNDVVAGRQVAAVDHQQDVRRRGPLVGTEPGPVAEVGRQQGAEVLDRGGDESARADGVHLARALRVGQPLDPVPVGQVGLGAEDRDDQLVGVVEGRRRADHRAGRRAGVLLGAAELDPVEGAQVDRGGQVGLQAVYDEEPVQRGRGRRVDLVDRGALRRDRAPSRGAARTGRSGRAGSCSSPGPCSHRRVRSSASAGSALGSGWCHIRARRCWSAALRATLRMLAR